MKTVSDVWERMYLIFKGYCLFRWSNLITKDVIKENVSAFVKQESEMSHFLHL